MELSVRAWLGPPQGYPPPPADAEVQVAGALLSMVDTWHVAHVANINTPDSRHDTDKAEVRVWENMRA